MDKDQKKWLKVWLVISLVTIIYAVTIGQHPDWIHPDQKISHINSCDTDALYLDSISNDTIYENYNAEHHSKGHNSMDADDEEYWNSVNREKTLRDAGQDRAADIEHKSRIEYLEDGGYHSQDGGSQVQFQGSQEQKDQLEQMDRMGW